jgi:hypothetical protein
MVSAVRVLLISTYELGRQPFGLASPAAWLRRAGVEVRCADLAKEPLDEGVVAAADLIAFHLPMHTATRLAVGVLRRVRTLNPSARLCAYGLYAPLNAAWLRSLGITDVFGGEFEEDLAALANTMRFDKAARFEPTPQTSVPKIHFLVPDRTGLPPIGRYATLQVGDGTTRRVGSTEASRGCRHVCRHCPIVPIYNGQFRVVQAGVVMADIDAQVAAGAEHITFGDPDFLNGPTHARRIVEALHGAHPGVTYDVTIKIEHLLRYRAFLPVLRDTGCLFVTSAVESLDDRVLARLEKGHTRAEFLEAVGVCRGVELTLVPTFVAFHPWLSIADYCDLLDTIDGLDLVDHVAPVQLTIRLLIPEGSRLLALPDLRGRIGAFDERTLTYRWAHADPRVDALQQAVARLVGSRPNTAVNRNDLFEEISALARAHAGLPAQAGRARPARPPVPFLSEPWYCCAEPHPEQLTLV